MWNYRVVKYPKMYDENTYGVVECYYNDKGEVLGFSNEPIITGESVDELLTTLILIKADLEKGREILDANMELAKWDDDE